jgi:hypothetical protein
MKGRTMIECLILGDSIAVGIAQFRPDCIVEAKVGINSEDYANGLFRHFVVENAEKTIISLGSNDAYVESYGPMLAIRELIKGDVVWILSSNNQESRFAALTIAKHYGDSVIDTASYPLSNDAVHPTANSYKLIANSF